MNNNNYWDVLKHPIVARLTLIQLISYFGTWFSQVAIASMMLEYGASELAIAYIFMMLMLPAIGLKLSLKPVKHTESALKMMKSGFLYLKNHKKLIHLILLHATIGFTSFETLITLLADLHYKYILAIPLAIGWINATRALAMTIGPLLFSKYINDKNIHYFFALQGFAIILWAFMQQHYSVSILGIFIVGLLSTSLWSYTYYMLQQEIEEKYLGRVIAYNDMIFMIFNITVTLFVGYAAKMGMELKYITIIMGCGFIATAFYYQWFKKNYLLDLDDKSV